VDWVKVRRKTAAVLKEYKFIFMIFVAGLILMLIPSRTEKEPQKTQQPQALAEKQDLQNSLSTLLSYIDGAGKVKVLLTQSCGEQIIYQTDTQQRPDQFEEETVILSGTGKEQIGLVRQTISPKYQGAVILCQGADKATVKLAIVQAVSNATGLSTDRITVLKMK